MANNNENKSTQSTKVITGLVRFSYCHVFKPESVGETDEPKYSVCLFIATADTETIRKIREAIELAKENGKSSKFGGKIPAGCKTPLRDGDVDREDDEAYADSYFVNCSSLQKPGIIDAAKNPITDETAFYSGCYGRASITFFAFNANGNKGIAAGLNNLQKLRDGDPLGGRQSAEADFDDDFIDDGDDSDF